MDGCPEWAMINLRTDWPRPHQLRVLPKREGSIETTHAARDISPLSLSLLPHRFLSFSFSQRLTPCPSTESGLKQTWWISFALVRVTIPRTLTHTQCTDLLFLHLSHSSASSSVALFFPFSSFFLLLLFPHPASIPEIRMRMHGCCCLKITKTKER